VKSTNFNESFQVIISLTFGAIDKGYHGSVHAIALLGTHRTQAQLAGITLETGEALRTRHGAVARYVRGSVWRLSHYQRCYNNHKRLYACC
jgi:hypothetical protein